MEPTMAHWVLYLEVVQMIKAQVIKTYRKPHMTRMKGYLWSYSGEKWKYPGKTDMVTQSLGFPGCPKWSFVNPKSVKLALLQSTRGYMIFSKKILWKTLNLISTLGTKPASHW